MTIEITPIVSLHSLINHPDADEFCITELVENGYEDDMKDLFVPMVELDQGDSIENRDEITIVSVERVEQGTWIGGRLYNDGSMTAVKLKGEEGLWMLSELFVHE